MQEITQERIYKMTFTYLEELYSQLKGRYGDLTDKDLAILFRKTFGAIESIINLEEGMRIVSSTLTSSERMSDLGYNQMSQLGVIVSMPTIRIDVELVDRCIDGVNDFWKIM